MLLKRKPFPHLLGYFYTNHFAVSQDHDPNKNKAGWIFRVFIYG